MIPPRPTSTLFPYTTLFRSFPSHYLNEVQVMATVLSADKENDPDVLSMIGGSAALHVSPIPFLQPTGSVRVGRVRSEEHTFELQSRQYLVCRLLLEKKNTNT